MNARLVQAEARRHQLVARIAYQRGELSRLTEEWREPLALADRGITVFNYLRRRPLLLAGVAVLAAVLRLDRAGIWALRGWMVWQLGNRFLKP